jgi:hypothetical protein
MTTPEDILIKARDYISDTENKIIYEFSGLNWYGGFAFKTMCKKSHITTSSILSIMAMEPICMQCDIEQS